MDVDATIRIFNKYSIWYTDDLNIKLKYVPHSWFLCEFVHHSMIYRRVYIYNHPELDIIEAWRKQKSTCLPAPIAIPATLLDDSHIQEQQVLLLSALNSNSMDAYMFDEINSEITFFKTFRQPIFCYLKTWRVRVKWIIKLNRWKMRCMEKMYKPGGIGFFHCQQRFEELKSINI
jgi:hypothetical protein